MRIRYKIMQIKLKTKSIKNPSFQSTKNGDTIKNISNYSSRQCFQNLNEKLKLQKTTKNTSKVENAQISVETKWDITKGFATIFKLPT